MIIDKHPTELHTAFNPCVIKATKGVEDKAKIFVASGIHAALPATYVTVEHEYFNFGNGNEAHFDIKKILRKWIGAGSTNLIANPFVNQSSNVYGFAHRYVQVEAGKTYTLSVNGNAANALNGKSLRVFIYKADWTWERALEITEEFNTTKSVTFTSDETTELIISSYYFEYTEPRTGSVTVNWYKFEKRSANWWIDTQFFVEYTVFDNLNALVYSATAVNAVAQLQESSSLTDKRGHFMTKFDKLKRYTDYPLEIVAVSFRNGDTFIRFDGYEFAQDDFAQVNANVFVLPITAEHYSIEIGNQNYDCYLRDNQGRVISDNYGNGITWTDVDSDYKQFILPIDNPCTPENPFYVKWKNQQGGFDYWMFGYRQFKTRSVSNIQTFNPVVTDTEFLSGITQTISAEGIESVKVGATSLTANEYECISRLIYSPDIQWWNEASQNWVSLIIDKGENEDDTNETLKELVFTFLLPTPQLQF